MQNKMLALVLFSLFPSLSFSTESLDEFTSNYQYQVSDNHFKDQDIIDSLEVLRNSNINVFNQFLGDNYRSEMDGPLHLAMINNRSNLFEYLLDNNAGLSYAFYNSIQKISPYFKDQMLNWEFIPLIYRASEEGRGAEATNKLFSFLYLCCQIDMIDIKDNSFYSDYYPPLLDLIKDKPDIMNTEIGGDITLIYKNRFPDANIGDSITPNRIQELFKIQDSISGLWE